MHDEKNQKEAAVIIVDSKRDSKERGKTMENKKKSFNLKKFKKDVQGITLIALVVTIIVLLILAGIALNLTIGQNGIFSRAQTAANTWRNAETNEQLAMGELENLMNEYIPQPPEPIEELEGNITYADFEGDGVADGIIFADLAVGNKGDGQWGEIDSQDRGKYTIPTETGLKQYYVVEEEYTEERFGNLTGQLIAPIDGSSGKDRFYVMALDDIDSSTHYWWKNAYGHLDTTYNVNYAISDFAVAGAEPTGLVNTRRMMECYENEEINGVTVEQGTNDMWGLIEEEVADGWFVPSKSEWAAFGGEVLELNDITSSNYDDYGLSSWCWSSSQNNTDYAYYALFYYGYVSNSNVNLDNFVRLATTF